jgi:hypothetical protein
VDPGWLDALVAAASDADIVGGRLDHARLNPPATARHDPTDRPRRSTVRSAPRASSSGSIEAEATPTARRVDEADDTPSSQRVDDRFSQSAQHSHGRVAVTGA